MILSFSLPMCNKPLDFISPSIEEQIDSGVEEIMEVKEGSKEDVLGSFIRSVHSILTKIVNYG